MNSKHRKKLMAILVVPLGLTITLIPFSLLIGWNLITLFLFWFIITPALAFCLPMLVVKGKTHLLESLAGLAIFYLVMVFMIYDHYRSDYFQAMIVSCVVNLILVSVIDWLRRPTTVVTINP